MKSQNDDEFLLTVEKAPNWFIRSGQSLLLLLLICFLILAYLIQYPNIIKSDISIVSLQPRNKAIARTGGYLQLMIKDHEVVTRGQLLCIIRSSLDTATNLLELQTKLKGIYKKNQLQQHLLEFKQEVFTNEVQPYYDDFLKNIRLYFLSKAANEKNIKKNSLMKRLTFMANLNRNQRSKDGLMAEKLQIQIEQLKESRYLLDEHVISQDELRQLEKSLLEQQAQIVNESSQQTQLLMTVNDIRNQMQEIDLNKKTEMVKLEGELASSFLLLMSKINEWESDHVIRAAVDGIVYFKGHRSNGQIVALQDELLSILPKEEDIFGIAHVPLYGAGELKPNQTVNIHLDSYPAQEYGIIHGMVSSISPVLEDKQYKVTINLPRGLLTTYGNRLVFKPELHGSAEIITKKMSLIEKFTSRYKNIQMN